jgi:hypothetical protein
MHATIGRRQVAHCDHTHRNLSHLSFILGLVQIFIKLAATSQYNAFAYMSIVKSCTYSFSELDAAHLRFKGTDKVV